ncbi:MAG: response regulator transcription factor [Aliidongia sp.]|jgi:two-component system invasion response regulator UvrY
MKLLVVDDHAVVRTGLQRLLQASPDIEMIEASDSEQAWDAFEADRPDVIIIDINLPGIGGLELLRQLISTEPELRALIFSMHVEPIYATQALKAGALGYVSKTAPPNEIIQAIRRVSEGAVYIEHQIAQEMALSSIPGAGPTDPASTLSSREIELLRLLGEGRSLQEMAESIGVSYKTVANTLSLLKARLGVSTTSELVRIAIKGGFAP